MTPIRPNPSPESLVKLFKKAKAGDPVAQAALKAWFDGLAAEIRRGQLAQDELGHLTYLVAEHQATRKMAPGRVYADLPNTPHSVGVRCWQKFQNFCKDVAKGKVKTVDDYVRRVNALIKYVFLDMAREKHRVAFTNQAGIEDQADAADQASREEGGSTMDYAEWLEDRRVLLRRMVEVLPTRPFFVLFMKEYEDFQWAQIAEMLGTTEHFTKKYYKEATEGVGRLFPDPNEEGPDPPKIAPGD